MCYDPSLEHKNKPFQKKTFWVELSPTATKSSKSYYWKGKKKKKKNLFKSSYGNLTIVRDRH